MNFLTDTHALLWHFTDSPKISQMAKEIFAKSENYTIIHLDHKVIQKMINTTEVSELHDKIIVATSKLLKVLLLTKDSLLHNLKSIIAFW